MLEEKQYSREQNIDRIVSKPLDRRIVGQLKKGFGDPIDYIPGAAMLVLMKEAFGPYYSIEFSEPKITQYGDTTDKNGKKIHAQQVVEVKCTLTVPMKDPETRTVIMVKREGFGSAVMKPKFEEMILKTAQTDAMKKAAFSFGFALELSMHENVPGDTEWFAEEMFDAWTQTNSQKFQKEWEFVRKYLTQYKIQDYNEIARRYYNDPDAHLTPKNMKEVVSGTMHQLIKERDKHKKKEDGAA